VQKACSRHIFQQSFDHYDNLEALIRNVCIWYRRLFKEIFHRLFQRKKYIIRLTP